jgi:hypothetical protein
MQIIIIKKREKNMQKTISLKNNKLLALTLMLTFAVSLIALPAAFAHDPPQTNHTFAYISAEPNPVGVGQSVFVVMWVSPNPPTALGLAGDMWRNFNVKMTKPDGSVVDMGTWNSDPTGSTFTLFTPDQVGTYKFDFTYPGQVMSQTGPTGLTADLDTLKARGLDVWIGDTYLGSSASTTLTVQQNPVAEPPSYPLPTGYWTRPIEGENTVWANIASNWVGGASIYGRLQPDGVAPNSAHIMWTRDVETGGIVGGTTEIPGVTFYTGQSYEGRFANPLLLYGRLYFTLPLGHSGGDPRRGGGGGYICLDLRTGEQIWYNDDIGTNGTNNAPTVGQLFNYESQNQHGVVGGMLWQISGSTWTAYDPYSGNWLYTLTNVPSGTEVYTPKGEIVRYVLNYDIAGKSGWLALWNNTEHNVGLEMPPAGSDPTTTEAYQWRPNGKTVDMSTAYSWNVTISADLSGLGSPSIVKVIPGDLILGTSTAFTRLVGTPDPYTIWAISDKPETRGQLLWIQNYSAPANGVTRSIASGAPVDEINRVFVMQDTETMQLRAYSIDDGSLKWGPVGSNLKAFQYYGTVGISGQNAFAAYGNFYTQGYAGEIHCYSGKDGTLLWKYNNTASGHETPWGNYPIFLGAIADGKIYAFNSEHSPNVPLYKGARVRCINATTGEEMWTMLSWASVGGFDSGTWPIADGYLVYRNAYDNQIYCVGKGPSATTAQIQNDVISQGNTVLITGTVTDVSEGAKNKVSSGEFNAIPAVSDQSMGPWMEYIYMQKPKPTDVTGVQVHLTAIDPNGNFQDLGYTITTASGLYSQMWTPPVPGKYVVTATFEGSESYYPSSAETAFGVVSSPSAAIIAPSTSPLPSQAPQPATTEAPTITYITLAAAVVIILVAAAALTLRRRV